MAKKLTKKQLVEILVEKYGYDKGDLKDNEGKPFTNAKLESMINQEEEDAKDLEAQETVVKARQTFKDEDGIIVMNGFNGSLTHRSKATGRVWIFREFGVTDKLPYSELLRIRNNNPSVFEDGWIIVLNKQIQEDFGLTEIYKNILTPDNIDKVFTYELDELKAFVDGLPESMKVTFVAKARELYRSKKIDSRRMIEFIEEKFGISLDDNAPLSDIV